MLSSSIPFKPICS
jgi:hypothetical protein